MKKLIPIIGILPVMLFFVSCEKEKEDAPIELPTVITDDIVEFDYKSAIAGGNVTSDGGLAVLIKGVCWNTTGSPSINDNCTIDGLGTGAFTRNLKELWYSTTYYVRAYAANPAGTSYGNEVIFKTNTIPEINFNSNLAYGSVSDVDGNAYKTIQIGTQTWMAENLKTTKYNEGTQIPMVTDDDRWYSIITPGYCTYSNDTGAYKAIYGALYNWYSVNTDKLCPLGWHVPSDAEWTTLIDYLGGSKIAGGKLKEIGTTHWDVPNTAATNETGFTALPGAVHANYPILVRLPYSLFGSNGRWWSSTEIEGHASCIYMSYDDSIMYKGSLDKNCGLSVRCAKD